MELHFFRRTERRKNRSLCWYVTPLTLVRTWLRRNGKSGVQHLIQSRFHPAARRIDVIPRPVNTVSWWTLGALNAKSGSSFSVYSHLPELKRKKRSFSVCKCLI